MGKNTRYSRKTNNRRLLRKGEKLKFTIKRTSSKVNTSIYRAFLDKSEVTIEFNHNTQIGTFYYVTNNPKSTQSKWDTSNFETWARNHIQTTLKGEKMEKVTRFHYSLAIDTQDQNDTEALENLIGEISTILRKSAEEGQIRGSHFDSEMTETIDEDIAFDE